MTVHVTLHDKLKRLYMVASFGVDDDLETSWYAIEFGVRMSHGKVSRIMCLNACRFYVGALHRYFLQMVRQRAAGYVILTWMGEDITVSDYAYQLEPAEEAEMTWCFLYQLL